MSRRAVIHVGGFLMDLEALLVVGSVRGFLGKIFHRVASRYVIGFILSGGFLELQAELANLAVEVRRSRPACLASIVTEPP